MPISLVHPWLFPTVSFSKTSLCFLNFLVLKSSLRNKCKSCQNDFTAHVLFFTTFPLEQPSLLIMHFLSCTYHAQIGGSESPLSKRSSRNWVYMKHIETDPRTTHCPCRLCSTTSKITTIMGVQSGTITPIQMTDLL